MSGRMNKLLGRLCKGIDKTANLFDSLDRAQWDTVLYEEPYPWTVRDLLAHLVSAEEGLLRAAQDVAAGGPGVPKGFDYDTFNAAEQKRLAGIPPERLLTDLIATRERTIAWVEKLQDSDLDRMGHHPALGEIKLEAFINAIHGHQLMHMREFDARIELTERHDVMRRQGGVSSLASDVGSCYVSLSTMAL